MVRVLKITALIALIVIVVPAAWRLTEFIGGSRQAKSDVGPTIESIAALSELTTLKFEVSDALVTTIPGYTGSVKAMMVLRGDVRLGVDMSQAKFEQVDREAKHVILRLPAPKVVSARLDHLYTKLVAVWQQGLWLVTPGGNEAETAAANRAMQEGQRIVESLALRPDHLSASREQTRKILTQFVESIGWTVEVRWE